VSDELVAFLEGLVPCLNKSLHFMALQRRKL